LNARGFTEPKSGAYIHVSAGDTLFEPLARLGTVSLSRTGRARRVLVPKIVNYLNHRHIQTSPLMLRLMRRG
jgi:hypothetical protein